MLTTGECTVFQDKKLVSKGTYMNPIILDPLFLHWGGDYITYKRFFSHLSAVINVPISDTMLSTSHILIGSDVE